MLCMWQEMEGKEKADAKLKEKMEAARDAKRKRDLDAELAKEAGEEDIHMYTHVCRLGHRT